MNLKQLSIKGFKSIGDIELIEPNPFSVFVGANASGKSNIFEALSLFALCDVMNPEEAIKEYGRAEDIISHHQQEALLSQPFSISFDFILDSLKPSINIKFTKGAQIIKYSHATYNDYGQRRFPPYSKAAREDKSYLQLANFTRLFIGNKNIQKRNFLDDARLSSDASNLEQVLKRILKQQEREEIEELLQLLIPEFDHLEVKTEEVSGSDNLVVYEKNISKPMTKRLISDGTYNIIALLCAIYQSDTPQFLCIEEPENGLNPKVIKQLVSLFRDKCEERGHYIWLNTHSQTLVSELRPEEIILVDKEKGLTQTKQIKGMDLHGMKMDEALLTNALGGGIPW